MKIIYLDIDGVLNSQDYADSLYEAWEIRRNHNKPYISQSDYDSFRDGIYQDEFGVIFDPRCVRWLDSLIKRTDAKIVMSSDWRKSGILSVQKLWEHRNLPSEIIDITPIHSDGIRENEILESVEKLKPEKWVAIDDITLDLKNNFVNTDFSVGLNRDCYHKCKQILL